MECNSCGTDLLPGKRFCHVCGTAAPDACSSCGAQLQDGFRFCPDCGTSVDAPATANPPAARVPGHAGVADSSDLADSAPPTNAADDEDYPSPQPADLPLFPELTMENPLQRTRAVVEGERKLVTVFFCDLAGSTAIAENLDPEEYRELLEEYVALAIREIYRLEGIVNQLSGDGVMALFGAPVAREDAPVRAVWAALAIHEALDQLNVRLRADGKPELRARVGIHTGPVVVGTVGNDLKMDYTAIGDTTNLASRLESLAEPGSILVSEETFALVRGFFDMEPAGPFDVKGKSAPVAAYRVLCRRTEEAAAPIAIAAERGLTPLVGRDAELAQLESCYERAMSGLPQVVALAGDTGSGRSRIVYELKKRLSPEPHFFEARCSALNQRVAFYPWIAMLHQYFGVSEGDPTESKLRKIATRLAELGPEAEAGAPYIYRMLSLPEGETDDMPAEDLERETFDAVGHLFRTECDDGACAVILEDVHWIDPASLSMLDRAIAKLQHAPMMFVLTHRPEFVANWQTSAVLTRLFLRRLSDDAARTIIRNVADGALPRKLEDLVLSKAEGSPFYTEEITRSLLESGTLDRSKGSYRLTRPVEEITLPGTVQEVIAARLDSLDPQAKRVVQVAAVIGRQVSREQLESLVAEDGIDVTLALHELEQRGVLHRKSIFSDDIYRFGESLTQEVAYEGLLMKQRRQLHERIGDFLERAPGEWTVERSARLAHHFVNSDNSEKAVRALLRAAAESEKVPAYDSSCEYYSDAWKIASSTNREQGDDTMRHLAIDAAQGIGRMIVLYTAKPPADVITTLARAADLAEAVGDIATKASLQTFRGMTIMTTIPGRFEEGLAIVEEALAAAQMAGVSLPGMARGLAWAYMLDGRFELAHRTIDAAISQLADGPQGATLADIYVGALYLRDRIHYFRGDFDAAERGALATRETAVEAGNRTVQGGSAGTLAMLHYYRGDDVEALRWARVAVSKAREAGNPLGRLSEAAIAVIASVSGGESFDESEFQEILAGELPVEGELAMGLPLVVTGLLTLGEYNRATDYARRGYARAAGRLRRMMAAQSLGDALSATGDEYWQEAREYYEEAIQIAEIVDAPVVLAAACVGAAELEWQNGNEAAALELAQRAREISSRLGLGRFESRLDELLLRGGAAIADSVVATSV